MQRETEALCVCERERERERERPTQEPAAADLKKTTIYKWDAKP